MNLKFSRYSWGLILINLLFFILLVGAVRDIHINYVNEFGQAPQIRQSAFYKDDTIFLPYKYVTQVGNGNAKDACEAAALKVALNHFGLTKHESLDDLVNKIPHNRRDPEKGYTGNPYIFGTHSTLYPKAMLRIAREEGAKKSYVIDDYYPGTRGLTGRKAPTKDFINALFNGYTIAVEGGSLMQRGLKTSKPGYAHYKSDHTVVIYGYKKGRFYWVDPDHRLRIRRNHHGSTSVKLFMQIINAPVRGPRAVAVGK